MRSSLFGLGVCSFLSILLGSGCQGRDATCKPAISGAIDRMVAEARGKMPTPAAANVARVVPKMKAALTASCERDQWAPNAVECFAKADGRAALETCDALLTPAQRDHERKLDDELLKAAIQPLQKSDPEKVRPDPHAGLGIPPVDELKGASPPPAPPAPGPGSGRATP